MADDTRWVRVRMQMARTPDHPEGSAMHGYMLVVPLDTQDHIDLQTWRENRSNCTVIRYWGNELPKHGWLVHRPGGTDGATWGFDYDAQTDEDDEAGFRFGDHAFSEGEYVSIRDHEGETNPFKIVAVERM
jgi:hypothetical protein